MWKTTATKLAIDTCLTTMHCLLSVDVDFVQISMTFSVVSRLLSTSIDSCQPSSNQWWMKTIMGRTKRERRERENEREIETQITLKLPRLTFIEHRMHLREATETSSSPEHTKEIVRSFRHEFQLDDVFAYQSVCHSIDVDKQFCAVQLNFSLILFVFFFSRRDFVYVWTWNLLLFFSFCLSLFFLRQIKPIEACNGRWFNRIVQCQLTSLASSMRKINNCQLTKRRSFCSF